MKLRNQLLALACMAAFVAMGYLYIRFWVVQKPFGIILFISDGMVARQITMARLYEGGALHRLGMENFPNSALLRNEANDFAVPDDAAVGTAFSTGVKSNHRFVAMDPAGNRVQSIMALAREEGRAVGLVTNGQLTDPVPAAFYAHTRDARETQAIAQQFVEEFRPDVALGGGALDFLPGPKTGRRQDGRDLLAELRKNGCEIVRTKAELENASFGDRGLVGLFSDESLAYSTEVASGSQQPSLTDMVQQAIKFLQQNRRGYLLVVDVSLPGSAASRNEGRRTITETIALDHAISTAAGYAGEKSLILAVGKHSTGGLSLNGFPQRDDHGFALLGLSPEGYPYLTWASGPNGPTPLPGAAGPTDPLAASPPRPSGQANAAARMEPAASHFQSALNTAEDVVGLGQGLGSEKLKGIMRNTDVYKILKDAL